jgi:hypothetical protein
LIKTGRFVDVKVAGRGRLDVKVTPFLQNNAAEVQLTYLYMFALQKSSRSEMLSNFGRKNRGTLRKINEHQGWANFNPRALI